MSGITRRAALLAGAAFTHSFLARSSFGQSAANTLRFVPQSDLPSLDPI